MRDRWTCACCGKEFADLATCWSVGPPEPYLALPEVERDRRAVLGDDFCTIDGEQFYIRGHILLPIRGSDETFAWSVWASLSRASVDRIAAAETDEQAAALEPMFGWLCSALPYDPGTVSLKTMVHYWSHGCVPYIEVEPTDHPLAIDQREGIDWEKVREIARYFSPHH